jgi:heme exporter protein B
VVVGVLALYDAVLDWWVLLVPTGIVTAVGLAAVGCVYGVLSMGQRVGATLLPLLMLPALAPLLLAATQAFAAATDGAPGESGRWLGLLTVFAAAYLAIGVVTFDILLDDA